MQLAPILEFAIAIRSGSCDSSVKEASSDGKLTREEAAQAMNAAKHYFLTHITSNSVNILREAVGPIKDWLDTFLEAKLGEYKGGAYGEVQKLANPPSPGLTD